MGNERSSTAERGYVDMGRLKTNEPPGRPEDNKRVPSGISERNRSPAIPAVVEDNMPPG